MPRPPRASARALATLAALAGALGAALPAAPLHAQGAAARVVRRAPATLYTARAPGPVLACAAPERNDLAALSDEFDGAAPLTGEGRWRWFHEAYGWPSMLRRADANATAPGQLHLEPALSGWFADYHGPFLFRTVTGDFDVTARVRSAPAAGGDSLPTALWSLVGVMARAPRAVTPADWTPNGENWLFITTGTAEAAGVPVFETKSTVNSGSNLKLRPARAGWVELRVVRLRETFLLLSRLPGESWRVRERVLRRDLPATMQVGLTAYSDGTSAPPAMRDPRAYNGAAPEARARVGRPDLGARVDWVRFRRPPALTEVAPDWLVDHEVSEAALLRFLDCGAAR